MLDEEDVLLIDISANIFQITFNRPKKMNALSPEVFNKLNSTLREFAKSDSRICLLKGAGGKAFIAGADIEHYLGISAEEYKKFMIFSHETMNLISSTPKIFIAAINGYALGGGFELAMHCDLIVASANSKLGLPETLLGLLPGGGGTQMLPRLVGRIRANDLIMRGRFMTAEEAFQYGLLSAVFSEETFEDELKKYISQVLKHAPLAQSMLKTLIPKGLEMTFEKAIQLETNLTATLMETSDGKEGIRAFIEKRHPKFESL
jgi:enoyl-CoA hydratase